MNNNNNTLEPNPHTTYCDCTACLLDIAYHHTLTTEQSDTVEQFEIESEGGHLD